MKKILLFALCIAALNVVNAQEINIRGLLKDSTNNTIIGASVKLTSVQDTLSTVSDLDGIFRFPKVKSTKFTLSISALGYQPVIKNYLFNKQQTPINLDPIVLFNDSRQLSEVVVNGTPDVTVKEDTLQFRADSYKLKENALAEDLLKKLPGVEVDRDGNVTAQGKQVTKVRINGKDFFGGDIKTATQQLPADVLQNVQIIDDYGDQANITGIRDGEPEKILNFTIRPDKNKGFLTRGTVAGGNQDRYQASVFSASFNNDLQVAVLGNLNNTNANIFSLTSGTTGGGGRRGRRGGNFGGGGFGGNSDGLTDVKSIGFNYRDEWGKKVTIYGSYSFSDRLNNVINNTFQQTLSEERTINNLEDVTGESENNSHRFNFNLEYKIDSLNYLKITPSFSYSTNSGTDISDFLIRNNNSLSSEGNYIDQTSAKSPNFGTDILYNHRFGAKPRNLSLSARFNTSTSNNEQDNINFSTNYATATPEEVYQRQVINNDNNNDNIRLRLSYSEPLSATKNLEFNYQYSYAKIDNIRNVLSSNTENGALTRDDNLSNEYEFRFITNRFGLNYRVNEKMYNYTVGFGVQPALLAGNSPLLNTSTRKPTLNIFPSGRFVYKFARTKELNINYNGDNNQPDYSQLQPITDNSNPQFPITGNPDLDAEFNNNVNIRYNNFDMASGNTFFTNLSYTFTKNKIITNTINDVPDNDLAIQETQYLNANGFYTVRGFYAFSKPFSDKKYVIGLRGSANYNNNISFIDDVENIGKNIVLSQRLNLQINPKDWLEVTPAVSYTYNKNNNSINQRSNTEINTWSLSFDSKIYIVKTLLFGTEADKNFNSGFKSIGANPFIINTYIEKQFFTGKTGSLRFTAFDLLNQNTNVSRTVNANSIIDRRSNRLAQYFMLSFTMRFNKFAGKNTQAPDMGRDQYRRRGPGSDSFN